MQEYRVHLARQSQHHPQAEGNKFIEQIKNCGTVLPARC